MSPRACAILLLLSFMLFSACNRSQPAQQAIFIAGKDDYHTYRIPAIIRSTRGTLLAFCEGRKNSRNDDGDIDIVLKRSVDNGRTWSNMQVVFDDGDNTIGNPAPVVDRRDGKIWLLFCRNNDRVFKAYSKDDGVTWSLPIEITSEVKLPNWSWYATGPGHGIQLQSGRLLVACDHRDALKSGSPKHSHVIYSDNHGQSWQLGGILPEKTDECTALETVDGQLYLNMRSYHGKHHRAVAWSPDGGQSWERFRLDDQLIEPVCQASVIRFTDQRKQNKNRILFSNPASRQRINMTIKMSYDEGETWPVARTLNPGPSAYSDLVILNDMKIGCLYERGKKHPYETITFATFDLDWLSNGIDRLTD